MSKRINVNPDHYKTAGRERPGKGVLVDREKRELTAGKRSEAPTKGARPPGPSKRSKARPSSAGR
jgi:hypothetical protein